MSGETYTVSADIDVVKSNVLEKINVRPVKVDNSLNGTDCNLTITNGRICGQIKAWDDAVKILIYAGVPSSTAGNHIRISHLKLEPGLVTDPVWTPAPEDVVVRSELDALIKRITALETKVGITSADSFIELPSMDVMESGSETASADDTTEDVEIN